MEYDAVLYFDTEKLNEDNRIISRSTPSASPQYGIGSADYIDPALYDTFSFGVSLRQSLNNIGDGFSAEVTDFKRWVVVRVSYHNHITGRTGSKTFLVVFKFKGDGMVFSTHNKWRSISGVSQASSYIRSASNALKGETNNKI